MVGPSESMAGTSESMVGTSENMAGPSESMVWTSENIVGFYPTPARTAFLTFGINAELGEVKQ